MLALASAFGSWKKVEEVFECYPSPNIEEIQISQRGASSICPWEKLQCANLAKIERFGEGTTAFDNSPDDTVGVCIRTAKPARATYAAFPQFGTPLLLATFKLQRRSGGWELPWCPYRFAGKASASHWAPPNQQDPSIGDCMSRCPHQSIYQVRRLLAVVVGHCQP